MKHQIAIILAAGIGKRFDPFITPKPLFPFMGKTMLQRALEAPDLTQIKKTYVVINPTLKKEVQSILKKFPNVQIVIQPEPKGMADAVLAVAPHISKNTSIYIKSTTSLIDHKHLKPDQIFKASQPTCVACDVDNYFPGGYLKTTDDSVQIIEKPYKNNLPSNLLKLVYDYIPQGQEFTNILKKTRSKSNNVYEKALNQYYSKYKPTIIEYFGPRSSLKYPHHVLNVNQMLLETIKDNHRPHTIHPSAVVVGPLTCGKNVTIMENAVVKGPVYLGDNVVVGTQAQVRSSTIESNSTIGAYAEVVRSYIGSSCKLHRTYVGDSVLEGANQLGAGSIISNSRFDKKPITYQNKYVKIDSHSRKLGAIMAKNVAVGSNATTMPGTVMGKKSSIYPGVVAKGHHQPQSIIKKSII